MVIMTLFVLICLVLALLSLAGFVMSIDTNSKRGMVYSILSFVVFAIIIIVMVSIMSDKSIEQALNAEEQRERLLSECLKKPEMEDRIVCRVKMEK